MFKINKAFLTYSWRWKINEDLCGICQQTFDQMCPKCTHPIECKPCVGMCDHTYHELEKYGRKSILERYYNNKK